ncbi:MAG: helicase, partial [Armatimonadota bacterium]|nr:helicase [Armatimonadota bacterium]
MYNLTAESRRYEQFLASKPTLTNDIAKDIDVMAINPMLFPFQRDVTLWALRKGKAAIFLDTGLGKTFIQLEWARLLDCRSLIIAPLSVARQTAREARKLDLEVHYTRSGGDLVNGINITNYEMADQFDPALFDAVVLDESSILKSLTGKTRTRLTTMFAQTPYRLCCTATPAPNDYTEIGNHSEFLGISTTAEMLGTFFVNANKQRAIVVDGKVYEYKGSNKGGQEWRLKKHAEQRFFEWLSTWAMTLKTPSDLGYDDDGFILPGLTVRPTFVPITHKSNGTLFHTGLQGLAHRAQIRRDGLAGRLAMLRGIVNSDDQWIIWVGLDAEGAAVTGALPGAIEVKGTDTPEYKARIFEEFQDGQHRILVTKGKIGGFGMNFQNAHRMIFFGLNDSWETFYQCIRRQWRYGQTQPVDVHVILSEIEDAIYRNVMRKEALAKRLGRGLIAAMKQHELTQLGRTERLIEPYEPVQESGGNWTLRLGDSCERLAEIPSDSVDLSVYSPPFVDLFTYSASDRDLGNSRNASQFYEHYGFIIREMYRVTKPGRLSCVHVSDIPAMASRDGYIGIKDFPGEVIRAHEREGWVFVGRAFVQKNPQAQAIRVKSKALLFVQLRKDSADSRPALIDQILLFKKPGDNAVPVTPVANGEMDNETWIEWAHGIWLGISESDTLRYTEARGAEDEKHICPLQLGTIER